MLESHDSTEPDLYPTGMPPSPSDSEEEGETSTPPSPPDTLKGNATHEDPIGIGPSSTKSLVLDITTDITNDEIGDHNNTTSGHGGGKVWTGEITTPTHPLSDKRTDKVTDAPDLPRGAGQSRFCPEDAVEPTESHTEIDHERTEGELTSVGKAVAAVLSVSPQMTKATLASSPDRSESKKEEDKVATAMEPQMTPPRRDEIPEMVPEDEKKSEEDRSDRGIGKEKDETLMPAPLDRQMVNNVVPIHQVVPSPQHSRDTLSSLPSHALPVIPQHHTPEHPHAMPQHLPMYGYAMAPVPPGFMAHATPPPAAGGRRKILLRLQEDSKHDRSHSRSRTFFFGRSSRSLFHHNSERMIDPEEDSLDRGSIAVSWYEGTTSAELQEHVRKSVIRKLGLQGGVKLKDLRIIDETMDPPEEIVLSPYIPSGSKFLLRFSTKEPDKDSSNIASRYLKNQIASTAPESPSAAPSPHPSSTDLRNLNEGQLKLLGSKLKFLEAPDLSVRKPEGNTEFEMLDEDHEESFDPPRKVPRQGEEGSRASTDFGEEEVMSMNPEDQMELRLRQLVELMVSDRRGKRERGDWRRRQEKKQVIFVMANYFVLFLSIIAVMAEIQSRAPLWLEWVEKHLESVQTCATDQESLFGCVSNGDFSGLIASFILWFGRSAATRRFFLFGFETPKRLWTVVYEALVTAFCWGISYMFIRRGMNPDTRENFLSKYWKDAVYGSLAGFNASFLKAVLKNLIPQEVLEDALQDRQLKILSWLPSFH